MGGAVCLGDILANQGYQQTSLLPHHKNFSGAGLFFKTHKVETKDLEYYQIKKMLPENYGGFWGIKDGVLFDLAKQELMQFDKNKPFALYLLSVDTHSKTGYTDKERCKALFDSPKNSNEEYQNAIFCTDTLLGEFVAWIKKQDFYPNTTIVILGDHLSMNYEFFPKNTHRTIYNAFINPDFYTPLAQERLNHRLFSHFDILPTLLDSLKVNVKGGKLGLGVDLLSTQPTLLESGDFEAEIQKRSKVYEGFLYQSDNAYP